MQRYKQPSFDVHPDGEWIRYEDHVEAMRRIAGGGARQAEPDETARMVKTLNSKSTSAVMKQYQRWSSQSFDRACALADRIIGDYKLHYDFPTQGESHMHDCIVSVLNGAAPAPASPAALTDEQIRAIARKYCRFVFPGVYSIKEFDCEEDFLNCARALLAQAAPSADHSGDSVGMGAEPVHLDGRICEHCGEGHTALTFEDGQFASNCDMCCSDCDYFMVERLNQLIAVPTLTDEIVRKTFIFDGVRNPEPAASPADQVEDARDAARYRWLRDYADLSVRDVFGGLCPQLNAGLDAAIDAAMSASKEGSNG